MSEPLAFPCPFCGSLATVIEDKTSEDWAPWIVRCVRCGNREAGTVETYGDTREQAVERWNRRVSKDSAHREALNAAAPGEDQPDREAEERAAVEGFIRMWPNSPGKVDAHMAEWKKRRDSGK